MPIKKRVAQTRPDRWLIGEQENWFSHMSGQGMHLDEISGDKAIFRRGEPEEVLYRIDFNSGYVNKGNYKEIGWEYICEDWDMSVYSSPKFANAPELHTDPIELSRAMRKMKNRFLLTALVVVIFGLGGAWIMYHLGIRNRPILSLVEMRSILLPFQAIILFTAIFSSIRNAIATRKVFLFLREGCAIDHEADWHRHLLRKKRIEKTFSYLSILPVAISIALLIYINNGGLEGEAVTLPIENSNPMVIRLADIENDPMLERKLGLEASDVDWLNYINTKRTPFAPVMLSMRETGIVPGREWLDGGMPRNEDAAYQPYIEYDLYKLRFVQMAPGLLRDLINLSNRFPSRSTPVEDFDHQGFERLFIRIETDSPGVEIFATRSEYIVRILYYGEENLDTVLAVVEDLFSRVLS